VSAVPFVLCHTTEDSPFSRLPHHVKLTSLRRPPPPCSTTRAGVVAHEFQFHPSAFGRARLAAESESLPLCLGFWALLISRARSARVTEMFSPFPRQSIFAPALLPILACIGVCAGLGRAMSKCVVERTVCDLSSVYKYMYSGLDSGWKLS